MADFARKSHLAIIVACTKADKVSKNAANNSMKKIADTLGLSPRLLVPVASLKKEGMDQLWEKIDQLAAQSQQ